MLSLIGVILYAVVARYFFNAAPAWSDEVPRVLFLWGTYIGIALAARRDKSLKVTFLLERLPPLGRLWLEMFMHVSIFVMLAFLLWYNVPVIELGRQTRMLATQAFQVSPPLSLSAEEVRELADGLAATLDDLRAGALM